MYKIRDKNSFQKESGEHRMTRCRSYLYCPLFTSFFRDFEYYFFLGLKMKYFLLSLDESNKLYTTTSRLGREYRDERCLSTLILLTVYDEKRTGKR